MQQDVGEASETLRMFKEHFLRNIITSEAAVERAFSRHKAVHSQFRANLLPDIVDDMLFVRYNIRLIYTNIPGVDDCDKDCENETETIFPEEED